MIKKIFNLMLLAAMIALGVMGARYLNKAQKPLEHANSQMAAMPVEVVTLREQEYYPHVIAYGNVEPSITLKAKTQVSGKVSYMHPSLKQGGSIPAKTEVIHIDPADYQTSLAQAEADLAATQAQLAQLAQEERNTQNSLRLAQQNLKVVQQNLHAARRKDQPVQKNTALIQQNLNLVKRNQNITQKNLNLAKRNLVLAKKDLFRLRKLGEQRLIALNQVEAQEQQVLQLEQQILQQEQALVQGQQSIVQQQQALASQDQSLVNQDQGVLQQQQQVIQQRQSITDIQGQLKTFASRRANLQAQIERINQQVKGQKTNLGRTKIRLPFDARIAEVEVEQGEFVGAGGALFTAINTDGIEIKADLPLLQINQLLAPSYGEPLKLDTNNAQQALESLALDAIVSLVNGDENEVWQGRVARFAESVDPTRRTISMIIAVDNPYADATVGRRLPLLKGMYTKVTISAPALEALVLPRKAVHEGRAFIMNEDKQLEIRPLDIQIQAGEDVLVLGGVNAGEKLIINDLVPVIEGMPLKPVILDGQNMLDGSNNDKNNDKNTDQDTVSDKEA